MYGTLFGCHIELKDIEELFLEKSSYEEIYSDQLIYGIKSKFRFFRQISKYFVKYDTQDNILVKTDRASMLNSIETRSVLDPGIADFLENYLININ